MPCPLLCAFRLSDDRMKNTLHSEYHRNAHQLYDDDFS